MFSEFPGAVPGAEPGDACQSGAQMPESLAEVVGAWEGLPEVMQAGILAMVRAAVGEVKK